MTLELKQFYLRRKNLNTPKNTKNIYYRKLKNAKNTK